MINLQEKLKNFDFKSLSKINLNQIDAKFALEVLAKRTDILIGVIFAGITIFASYYLFNTSNEIADTIKKDIAKLEEKQTAAIEFEKQKNKLESVQKTIPQGFEKETEIIKEIINLAAEKNVKVVFYTPGQLKNEDYYSVQVVDFVFKSSYAQMLALLRVIEQNKKNLRIVSWKNEADSEERQGRQNQKTINDDNTLKWKISVSSTLLNYEK